MPLRRRHGLRQEQHERQPAHLAQPVEAEERLAAGDPQQGGDVEPVEPADRAWVPLVEPGGRHEQHVAGSRLLGDLHHRTGVVDLGDDDELGDGRREVRPGQVEVVLVAGEDDPGQPFAPGAHGVHDSPVDGDGDPGQHDDDDEVLDGERQGPRDQRAALLEQAGEREVEQGDEAARRQREPGGLGQHGGAAEPRLALVETTEVEGGDEDQGRHRERHGVRTCRVGGPRRGATEAVEHHRDRQPEDGQAVEQHDEAEPSAVEPSQQRGDGTPSGAPLGHRRLSRVPHPRADTPGSDRRGRSPGHAPRARPRARGRRLRRRPRAR